MPRLFQWMTQRPPAPMPATLRLANGCAFAGQVMDLDGRGCRFRPLQRGAFLSIAEGQLEMPGQRRHCRAARRRDGDILLEFAG